MSNGRRTTPIHRALHRPMLVAGGERNLMLSLILLVVVLVLPTQNMVGFISGLIVFFVGRYGLIRMAKADPMMSAVYKRQIQYKNYYGPYSKPWRVSGSKKIY